MHRYLILCCFFGGLLLSACQAGNAPQDITPSVEYLTTQVIPSFTVTGPGSLAPPSIQETPASVPGMIAPTLLYIQENRLIEQSGDSPPKEIKVLPEAGKVLAAINAGQMILVLREQGIQRLNLNDGMVDMVFQFDVPAQYGDLLLSSDSSRIFFYAVVSDDTAEFGSTTLIGYYDLVQNLVKTVSYFPQTIRLLGFTQDRFGLYLLPLGQDPEFGMVFVYDLERNEITEELPVQGTNYASLAPGARLLAVASYPEDIDEKIVQSLNLYDLPSLPHTTPRVFVLPATGSQIYGFLWSPDARELYFLLFPPDYAYQPETTNGLWCFNVETGEMSQIANINDPAYHLISIDPQGEWILLMHESEAGGILISLPDGKSQSIPLPVLATFVGWK